MKVIDIDFKKVLKKYDREDLERLIIRTLPDDKKLYLIAGYKILTGEKNDN